MQWVDHSPGGVLELHRSKGNVFGRLQLHVLLLDGETWAFWMLDSITCLGVITVGQA
jgi:hypothetical protein